MLPARPRVRSAARFSGLLNPPLSGGTGRAGTPAPGAGLLVGGEIPTGDWQALSLDFAMSRAADEGDCTLDPARLSNMILTSGSSGTPKAVVAPAGEPSGLRPGLRHPDPLNETCGWLLSLPLFHARRLRHPVPGLPGGAALVLDDRSQPLKARLERQPITHLSLVPAQLWRLLAAGFEPSRTRVRELLLGGAAIPTPW